MSNKIWYLPGPFHQYQEDVKALAKEAGLRIIDANVTESRDDEADNTPEVTLKEVEQHLMLVVGAGSNQAELEELIGKLRAESDTVRAVIDGLDAGEIEKPEAGELAIRLFQALDVIRLQMVALAGTREDLAAENEKLRNELTELKAGEGVEVEALKAKLDTAGVTYRANASKESLEKLVADLPKA
ncbi:hypothetical protein J3D54_005531 [Pseudomonas sp. GGS8]|uniref:hypothetical protein n=1 Tax=Pseudomonas sp. GGS8 TaxID=2817892 RepID=UPI00209D6BA3|nr:hypothetical protein [Pseudomonas sp. GGS8]MCP1446399.1 hypothetical protein [Pseudomonas sp. GGS8]